MASGLLNIFNRLVKNVPPFFSGSVYFILTILVSCKPEINVDLLKNKIKNSNNPAVPTLIFPITTISVLSGDSVTIATTNGTGPYSLTGNPVGIFDSATTSYTAPDSLAAYSLNLSLTDLNGLIGELPVKIIGLKEKFLMDQPLAYGDQNYPMSIVQADDNSIYATSVIIDGTGWEGLATWKSTNNGATWNIVDRYFMYLAGETHPMELTAKGNDIYVCAYTWGYGGTPSTANSEWLIRKSSNAGATWVNVDHSWKTLRNNSCTSITTATNGNLFAAGYSDDPSFNTHAIIKTSLDDGASWQEIGYFPNAGAPSNIRTSPNGDLWVVIENKLYKGTYSLGTWNWSAPLSISASTFGYVAYQKRGQLFVENDTTAYFTTNTSGGWIIYRTLDSGLTWNQLHSRPGEGVSILVLSTGEIISNGARVITSSEKYNQIIKSSDGGVNFNLNLNIGGLNNEHEGGYLYELNNGNLISLGYRDLDYQVVVHSSVDKGDTWSESSIIYFYDRLYSEVSDYAEDGQGNIYTAGWIDSFMSGDPTESYVIMKSSNNGTNWSQSDSIFQSGVNHFSDQIEVSAINNYIFATAHSHSAGNTKLRMSTDAGLNWSTVDTLVETISEYALEIDSNGYVYYITGLNLRRGSPTGTGFSTIYNFPMNGAQTVFRVKSLLALEDGSLLLNTIVTESGVTYAVIYKSLNQGIGWNEIYRGPANFWNKVNVVQAKNEDLYLTYNNKIFKSINTGTTWTEIYNTTMGHGDVYSIATSNDSQIFFTNRDEIFYFSTNTSSWNTFWRINTAITPNIDSYVNALFSCKFSTIGICANVVDYTKGQGTANYLWAAE